jgi:hypothetical protein
MTALLVGYARCSTEAQDLTAQRDGLVALGVAPERVYVDHGLTGTNRERPGLREALAACRAGDTLVVTKLDRLARSLPDARAIADELTARGVALKLGGSVYDPTDAVGRLLFNVFGVIHTLGCLTGDECLILPNCQGLSPVCRLGLHLGLVGLQERAGGPPPVTWLPKTLTVFETTSRTGSP